MRTTGSGTLGTLLMLAPLVAVPVFAIVGIPEFVPASVTPSDELAEPDDAPAFESHDAGEPAGESIRHGADDLFAPLDGNPFDEEAQNRAALDANAEPEGDAFAYAPPAAALDGWNVEEPAAGSEFEDAADEAEVGRSLRGLSAESRRRLQESVEPGRRNSGRSPGRAALSRAAPGESLDIDAGFDEPAAPAPRQPPERMPVGREYTSPKMPAGTGGGLANVPSDLPDWARADVATATAAPTAPRTMRPVTTPRTAPLAQPVASDSPEELTWRSAVERLQLHNVVAQEFHYLDEHEAFRFRCAVLAPGQTEEELFEAEAPELLWAVADVLAQVEQRTQARRATARPSTPATGRRSAAAQVQRTPAPSAAALAPSAPRATSPRVAPSTQTAAARPPAPRPSTGSKGTYLGPASTTPGSARLSSPSSATRTNPRRRAG